MDFKSGWDERRRWRVTLGEDAGLIVPGQGYTARPDCITSHRCARPSFHRRSASADDS